MKILYELVTVSSNAKAGILHFMSCEKYFTDALMQVSHCANGKVVFVKNCKPGDLPVKVDKEATSNWYLVTKCQMIYFFII